MSAQKFAFIVFVFQQPDSRYICLFFGRGTRILSPILLYFSFFSFIFFLFEP